ncbi:MAG: two-component sensor histidine kinase [Planctomycetaceae bacterium]|jgi:signal transduction histidine kinase|nr:two-component sensor histidine kinase [Planctomycetaceae bacterium]
MALEKTLSEIHDQLVEQYAEIAQLAGGLAHEIKNPLSTIRLNIELMAEDLAEGDSPQDRRVLRKIDIVKRECLRLEELLNDFLNFARAHKLELEPLNVNTQLRETLDFFRPRAVETGIEVIEYYGNNLPTVMLDKRSFHRAILNLVLNAQQAMPEGGQLVVRTRTVGDRVAIDLIDTGCGIEPETIKHLFDAFYSTKRGGSGLGLPTTRKIIEGHGGLIALQSEPGFGTQFTIILPSLKRLRETGD